MKSGALRIHRLELALVDFGRDLGSSDSWRAKRNFGQVNNAQFHRFSRWPNFPKLEHSTLIGVAM